MGKRDKIDGIHIVSSECQNGGICTVMCYVEMQDITQY
jgi:hypothetical protein